MCPSQVLGECGLAAECLATSSYMASVWPLASVNATMPGQGGGVAKCLAAAEPFTTMRSFASVYSDMHGQGTSLDETLIAELAGVGTFVGVDPMMSSQVTSSAESLRGLVGQLANHL